ncbi:hypothetical protein ACFLXG_02530 [Chloroflexota bacterium]
MSKCVMIVGLGDLGGWVLELLARCDGVQKIVTTDIREEWGYAKTSTAAVGVSQQGYNKRLEFHKLDITDVDRSVELLDKVRPDMIYSATTLQSWWVPYLLPPDLALKAKKAGVGPLVAGHMPLIHKLMLAIKQSGIKTKVLNNSFPDVINPVLWRNGLGPDIGSGNSDLIMEDIRQKVSYDLNVPPQEVAVYLYTAHATCMQAHMRDIPFLLKIYVAGQEVTSNYDLKELVRGFAGAYMPAKMTTWLAHPRVAASAVKNIMAMLNNTNELSHMPGPKGLPGGYSVRVNADGAEVVLPEGITMEEATKVNLEVLKYDGIEEIKDDGTIVFTEECRQLVKEYLGTDIGQDLKLEDAVERASEVKELTNKVAAKYNVKLEL